MTDHKTCEGLLDYFNNTLTEKEKSIFEAHLSTCHECQEELQELTMLTEDLPFSADLIEPNEGMKERILTAVFEQTDAPVENKENVKNAESEEPAHIKEFKRPNSKMAATAPGGIITSIFIGKRVLLLQSN